MNEPGTTASEVVAGFSISVSEAPHALERVMTVVSRCGLRVKRLDFELGLRCDLEVFTRDATQCHRFHSLLLGSVEVLDVEVVPPRG
ncbi:MAG: hypothetical protein M3Z03_14275 [Actinomycetota bacterium]|nr:hypothetical protein [Actinomycetota bacterium]